jgi:hypothetical protein
MQTLLAAGDAAYPWLKGLHVIAACTRFSLASRANTGPISPLVEAVRTSISPPIAEAAACASLTSNP